jgi:hypothetical protein
MHGISHQKPRLRQRLQAFSLSRRPLKFTRPMSARLLQAQQRPAYGFEPSRAHPLCVILDSAAPFSHKYGHLAPLHPLPTLPEGDTRDAVDDAVSRMNPIAFSHLLPLASPSRRTLQQLMQLVKHACELAAAERRLGWGNL